MPPMAYHLGQLYHLPRRDGRWQQVNRLTYNFNLTFYFIVRKSFLAAIFSTPLVCAPGFSGSRLARLVDSMFFGLELLPLGT